MKQWQHFLKNLFSLLEVKSIITLTIILVFCYKTLMGTEITSEFVMIASAIITYYFAKPPGLQKRKPDDEMGELK